MRGRGVGEGAMVEERERRGMRERDGVGFGRAGGRGRRVIDSIRYFLFVALSTEPRMIFPGFGGFGR